MGFRNPFRIAVDRDTGNVYVGDYGPDGGADPLRGPDGQVEFDVVRRPGNFGWPYCIGDNEPYRDYDFATGTSGAMFVCNGPVNESPRNTGARLLPRAVAPDIWYGTDGPWEDEMRPGNSESPMAGPIYRYDAGNPSTTKFPAYFDRHWFPYEWGRDWIKETALDPRGAPLEVSAFLDDDSLRWQNPMDMEFGPEGSLYVLDYGSNWFGGGPDSALYRVDYVKGGRRPIVETSADPATSSAATQTVQFSSEGTRDPDGDPITYDWDFGDGTAHSTEPNPTHTYTAVGSYRATLTVTDDTGRSGSDDVTVVVGNAAPTVEISSPAEGSFFDFGDAIPFEVTVTDAEDGTVSGDHAACSRLRVQYLLGHDEHSHPITDATGCRGTIQTSGEAGHGADANVFGLISATYTDGGGLPGAPALGGQDGLRIWPKLLQAEHFVEQRGVIVYAIPGAAGGEQVGSTEDDGTDGGVNYIAWEPVDLAGIGSITVTVAAGGDGGPIEVRLDDPVTGPLLGTIAVTNTGGWETYKDFTLPITPPTGKHKLVFAFPTGGMDVDQIRFTN